MELTIPHRSHWPNTIVFPKELRDAIPPYGSRALVFDSVTGLTNAAPIIPIPGCGPRARAKLLVHETGRLTGEFELRMRKLHPQHSDLFGEGRGAQRGVKSR
jgi:hypothetical protein